MSTTRAVWIFILVLTGIRLSFIGATDLSFDEAHYWMWSQRLAPAYFSKGPGVAYTIWSSVAMFGPTEFGVRFWSPIVGAGTSLLLYYFARRLFSDVTGFWTVLALNVVPIFNIGSFLMTTDPLSIFFWVAAMFAFWLALERSPAFSWYWPLTGLLVGLGFLCKYTNALQLISIAVVLALVPRLRREFVKPGLYSLLAVFIICTLPPLIWNSNRMWATVGHLRNRGGLDRPLGIHPGELLSFFSMHFAVFSPLLFFALVWAVIASWRRAHQQFKGIFLIWFGLPVFIFYALLSTNHAANANWDALAFLSLAILATSYWRERLEARPRLQRWAVGGILLGLILSVIAVNTDVLHGLGIHPPKKDPSDRIRSWRTVSAAVEDLRHDVERDLGHPVFMIADERARASEFAFYFKDKRPEGPGFPPVFIVESQDIMNQFSFWPRYDEFIEAPKKTENASGDVYTEEGGVNPFQGRDALYVQNTFREPPHNISQAFASTEAYRMIQVRRYGRLVRTLYVFVCRNYRPLPL
ncbi:MAG: glycosyltransferase family 39 protein [Verrucomicrobiota bacterium]|nr:glycosyltransferase family 39 protein [Verrucomicrobiota bacterium]